MHSQRPLIQTLKGPKNMSELVDLRIIESCHKNSSRPSEWKKNIRKCLNKNMIHFYRVCSRMRYEYENIRFCITVLQSNLKSMSELVCWLTKQRVSNKYFKMLVSNDFMLGGTLRY